MQIELRQLRYFVAVAEELHFGRAAKKLHMTQPPLSQAIQGLEAELGAALFHRTTRQIQLSAAGLVLLPEAKRLLAQAGLLPAIAQRAAAGAIGELRLAFISIADYSILPPALRHFRQHYDKVKIVLHEATSDRQLALLENAEIDLGLLIPPIPDRLKDVLHYQKLRRENLILALPDGAEKRAFPTKLSSYKDLPLILFPRTIAPALHDTILGCFREAGMTPVIAQEAIQMQTIIALVSAGMGMALVPESVANLQRIGVHYQILDSSNATRDSVELGIAWRRDSISPVTQAFLDLLEK
ncbi:LysR family transcriptional regulator [Undibacterium amnicola]|uniref:LysR family transcriptional regulator n=1 Tax=Undibacterium amnicola TaxID=1834038 RepID=A0ABR6XN80_9BURK|nr:LysR family transcriptional regulator [Undibacterium amnicola]MBC3830836.1 LysR family transcriptional regulator [Undibacterium amnicola]